MEFSREVTHRYLDALDHVWTTCAERVGLRVERTEHAYATTNGRGLMGLAHDDELDADDNVAQMVFHELCHSLVEGPDSFEYPDWGLDNETDQHFWREHACLRTQAVLAGGYGLRRFFAPTTDFRAFYDALPPAPLTPRGEPSVLLAVQALQRAAKHPWAPHLHHALDATATIVGAVTAYTVAGTPRAQSVRLPPLYELVDPRPALHPLGFGPALDPSARHTCGDCGWLAREDATPRCRQADGAQTDEAAVACDRWEPPPDCLTCGACCREAYHSVTVDDDDPVIAKHPHIIVQRDTYIEVKRDGNRCSMLSGGPPGAADYVCAIYEDRPRCCRELERAGEHCLTARRRVGLSR